jgi:ATP-dependent helicase HrpA
MKEILQALSADISECMLADRRGLERRLRTVERRRRAGRDCDQALASLRADTAASKHRAANRRAALPVPDFPATLPVAERADQIAAAIAAHPVVVLCGETGSGKTTQLPKICLALGRGAYGLIGHTQPRRIAARSVAARIASELGTRMGDVVGYKIRFRDHVNPGTHVKVMTDGILLAEIQADRLLAQYDTLIIDEAHERSLNIDFLLGYLARLLPERPELRLIITSATIDPQRFARHFGDAPVIEVSGRTYPVEVRYRPLAAEEDGDSDRDMQQAILDAVDELSREGPGDMLVFLSGEREIRETAESLRKHHPRGTEILPLYARLGADEQNRVFQHHGGRRIVLTTNVAETSLTVPGIRYVVDTGFARLSRYSYRTKVQRLPVERISQASANQRKGRCGRIGPGVCIRLYAEEDFLQRPAFTDPEILRTNLASVILQMTTQRLGDIAHFPFIDPPDPRLIKDGYRLLEELGAMKDGRITPVGERLARLPVDPRIGRMVIAAKDLDCLHEVLIIASALSIQDPRERPYDRQQKADAAHEPFVDESSDFLTLLKLWDFYGEKRRHLSRNQTRKLCRQHFLSWTRMEEWRDVHSQLTSQARDMGMTPNREPAGYAAIHQALLTGLVANIGFRTGDHEYTGARGTKFTLFPGSRAGRKRPKWIMAAELIETTRLYGHITARVEPAWIERLAAHLLRRSFSEPHWEKRRACVMALEKSTLYGLTLHTGRRVHYGPIDPVLARELFIRHALVGFDFETEAPFFAHNRRLVEEIESLEHRTRRHDIMVESGDLYRFYDDRIPAGVYSGRRFEHWRLTAEGNNPGLLFLAREDLMRHDARSVTRAQFPPTMTTGSLDLQLTYHFEPGHPEDGVTLTVPLPALNGLDPHRFEWLVPGLLAEKITSMIKTLPKSLRRNFVPVPAFAAACMDALQPGTAPLREALAAQLRRMTGVEIPPDILQGAGLPEHCLMNFRVVDEAGRTVGMGRDLEQLQAQFRNNARQSFSRGSPWGLERAGLTDWGFGTLPESVTGVIGGITITGYPALDDREDSVAVEVFDTADEAARAHPAGLRRLFMLRLSSRVKYLCRHLPGLQRLCLLYMPFGGCAALQQDLLTAIFDRAFLRDQAPVRSREAFEARLGKGGPTLVKTANDLSGLVKTILETRHEIEQSLKGLRTAAHQETAKDIRGQLEHLVYAGFIVRTPERWLVELPRYLQAILIRLEKLGYAPERDRRHAAEIAPHWRRLLARDHRPVRQRPPNPELETYRWMIEEMRVSLFAQQLGTLFPVSLQRLQRQWERISTDDPSRAAAGMRKPQHGN